MNIIKQLFIAKQFPPETIYWLTHDKPIGKLWTLEELLDFVETEWFVWKARNSFWKWYIVKLRFAEFLSKHGFCINPYSAHPYKDWFYGILEKL